MTTWSEPAFPPGTQVTGKWNRGVYIVERLLGAGANGKVYLVQRGRSSYAMKIGFDPVDLQSEANVLRKLVQSQKRAEPYLVDVDDFRFKGKDYPFYIMKYVRGCNLQEFIQQKGKDWFRVVLYHLLCKLNELHEAGWAFGDVKIENVLVSDYGYAELVDYGGVTPLGRSVKQFTEIYDRGYWAAGTRVADQAYDLFSFAVLCVKLMDRERFLAHSAQLMPQTRSVDELLGLIRTSSSEALREAGPWLEKALRGGFATSREACREWQAFMHRTRREKRARSKARWIGGMFAVSAALLVATLYLMQQL